MANTTKSNGSTKKCARTSNVKSVESKSVQNSGSAKTTGKATRACSSKKNGSTK